MSVIIERLIPKVGQEVRQAIFKEVSKEDLEQAVMVVNRETSPHAPQYYNLLTDGYGSVRLFLPALLNAIAFKSTSTSDDLLAAWQFLYKLDHARPHADMRDAPREIIMNAAWRSVVYNQENLIDRRYYTFCVLHYWGKFGIDAVGELGSQC